MAFSQKKNNSPTRNENNVADFKLPHTSTEQKKSEKQCL